MHVIYLLFKYLKNNLIKAEMCTHDVFLPKSVLWIIQQQLFGYKGAVKPHSATANNKLIFSPELHAH